MDFPRTTRRRLAALPLVPMIDIMFILIIFFMLTTTFMRVESLELMLPSAGAQAGSAPEVVRLYIQANGDTLLGQRKLDAQALSESLTRMFQKDPGTKVMLLTADGVTMQQLVSIMDKIYTIGGRSLFVRKWETAAGTPAVMPDLFAPPSAAEK